MGVNVIIDNILNLKSFLESSAETFSQIDRIDFQDIQKYFPKTNTEVQLFKNALSQCTALRAMSFMACKLHEFNVDDFRVLGDLFLQCPNLDSLDVKRTIHGLLLIETSENEMRFQAFCEALGGCSNLKMLNFNENIFDGNINENCFRYLIAIIKKLRLLYNIQYGVNDFKLVHARAIDSVLVEHRKARQQPNAVVPSVFFSAHQENKVDNEKKGFLNRQPDKINMTALYDGKFLLEKSRRDNLMLETVFNSLIDGEKFLYFNKNHEAFVGSYNTSLGRGQFAEVFVIQNALTGKWHCLKILKKGALNDNEVSILAEEGMLLSSDKTPNEDLLMGELIHGKSLKAFMQENRKSKLFFFEKALSLMISFIEGYESLHRKNYVHRDIKPDNVIFDPEQQKCVAIDFGLVKKAGEASGWGGSFKYMAPEAFSLPSPHLQNDIYAMGMVIGEILASVIGEHDLCNRQVAIKYYEQQSLDTNPVTQERYEYLKETCKRVYAKETEINGFIKLYLEILPVLFGAKNREYQEQRGLSKEAVELCRLICQMTEPLENRPNINAVLQNMRTIRLEHIENRRQYFSSCPASPYNNLLNALYQKRRSLNNAPYALDNLDIFLLRVVDANEKNRPTVEEMERYLMKLENILTSKNTLNYTFKMQQLKKVNRNRDAETQEYLSTEKENRDPQSQNMAIPRLSKKRSRSEPQKECQHKQRSLDFVRQPLQSKKTWYKNFSVNTLIKSIILHIHL